MLKNEALRILLIDDDDLDARIVTHHLNAIPEKNVIVTRVATIDDAQNAFHHDTFDIALVDYKLNDQETGLEFSKRIGGHHAKTPMILLTGMDDWVLDRDTALQSTYGFIEKLNITHDGIYSAILTAIERHQATKVKRAEPAPKNASSR